MNANKFFEYKNVRNGGRERVYRIDGKFYVSSDWGRGFFGKTEISRSDMESVLVHTKAPAYVVIGIFED
jgi:hypothetical protein